MVIEFIEVILEYMGMVLCIHKVAKKRFRISRWVINYYFFVQLLLLLIWKGILPQGCKVIIYMGLFCYTQLVIVKSWRKTFQYFGIAMLSFFSLQIFIYIVSTFFISNSLNMNYGVIWANLFVLIILILWNDKFMNKAIDKINSAKEVIVLLFFGLILIRILCLYNQNSYFDWEIGLQFLIETIGLIMAYALWTNAENEKKHKIKEVQMYETYNQAFEGAIRTIRARQHEFDNHINAIKCLQYTIEDKDKVLELQNQYCDRVLQENDVNKLLKVDFEPVIIGFIYSKIITAKEKGIKVNYEIQNVEIKERIHIYEFIEILGILLDNAIEAMEENSEKIIILHLVKCNKNSFVLEVANSSRFYHNSEIEKFCLYGYSTKGNDRGTGLTRLKDIVASNKADLFITNRRYEEKNYLVFEVTF